MRIKTMAVAALLGVALTGCAAGGAGVPAKASTVRPSIGDGRKHSSIVVVPEVMSGQGLGGVIGSPAAALVKRFGEPRLDLTEGDAHKLQFAGKTCVLDIFLYPTAAGAQPTATHVEARVRLGGARADPGTCIREVERR